MSTSPTDVRQNLAQLLVSGFPAVNQTLGKLSALSVVKGITGNEAKIDFAPNEIENCRAFIYTADAIRSELGSYPHPPDLTQIFDKTAEAFEQFQSVLEREPDASRKIRSSLNYVGAIKLASAYMVAPVSANGDAEPGAELIATFAHEALRLLLRHDYRALLEKYSRLTATTTAKAILENPGVGAAVKGAVAIAVARAVTSYADYSIHNDTGKLETGRREIQDASRLARHIPDRSTLAAVEQISYIIERYPQTYSRRVLQHWESRLGKKYLSLLTGGRNAIHQLWPSQIEAVEQKLLDARRVAVSMPTSAGKTLLAELKIAAALNANPKGCVFYVVPLNALARQIQRELHQRLRHRPLSYNIKVLTGAYEIEDTDLAGTKSENVLITTPEKLDGLLRHSQEDQSIQTLLDRCSLVIFDEFQNLGEGRRGMTYEFLIARVRSRLPSAEILCLCPIISNINEVAQWIGSEVKGIRTVWRPTRLHTAAWSPEGLRFDGAWALSSFKRSASGKEDLARIALDLQSNFHSVLIMATTRATAESYANQIWQKASSEKRYVLSGDDIRRLKGLADYVRSRTHEASLLAKFIELGIAYHHSHVPLDIRTRIEDLIIERHLKIVVATTTLAEGVNMPVKCVVVPSVHFGTTPIPSLKLQNIFGRAARAGYTTEGQVIVFQKSQYVYVDGKFHDFYQYCFHPPNSLLEVRSTLEKAIPEAESADDLNLLQALDSQILGMFLDGTAPKERHSAAISDLSFCTVEQPERKDSLERLVQNRIDRLAASPTPLLVAQSPLGLTDLGRQAARVGLGGDEVQIVVNEIERLWGRQPSSRIARDRDLRLNSEFLKSMLVPCFLLPQNLFSSVGIGERFKSIVGVSPSAARERFSPVFQEIIRSTGVHGALVEAIIDVDLQAILRWLDGTSPTEFAELFQSETAAQKISKMQRGFEKVLEASLMDALHYFDHISSSMSYSVFMVENIARLLAEKAGFPVSAELGNCYLYLKYGVSHPVAVFLVREASFADRPFAMSFAAEFSPDFAYTARNAAIRMREKEKVLRSHLTEEEFDTVDQAMAIAELPF